MCVCVCLRGLWGVGGSDGGGKGTEEVNTRSGMTQLCGGLVPKTTHTGACVCVCESACDMRHATVTASLIFSNQREKQKQTILPNYSQPQPPSLALPPVF